MDVQSVLFGTNESEFKKVMDSFEITNEVLEENVEKLKSWIKSQPHLSHLELEPAVLKRCLFGKMYSFELAKFRIEKLHIYRAQMPHIFENYNINNNELRQVFDVVNICMVPQKLPDNSRITLINLNNPDPNVFNILSALKVYLMVCDVRLKYDTHFGSFGILDCKNLTLTHFLKALTCLNLVKIFEDCYEGRTIALHIVNTPDFGYQTISKLKSFVKKNVADKIHVHKDAKMLKDIIGEDYLPCDYGGRQMSSREISLKLRDALGEPEICKWFAELENQKSNESERVKNMSQEDNEFTGSFGTFRRMDFD